MILKGEISSIEASGTRVAFKDRDSTVSAPIKTASHINDLKVGDKVVVAFFSNNMSDGLIIARW